MTISNANRELVASLEKIIGIIDKMGIRIEEYEQGYVKIRLPKEPNVNHIGTVYAGSLFFWPIMQAVFFSARVSTRHGIIPS